MRQAAGQREALVVAEGRDLDTDGFGGIDQQGLRRDFDGASVDREID
jgi:hypothetical protein